MFRNRFDSIVKEGKSLSKNEYATAIFYVIHIAEHQYETWSDENGNITNEVIIEQIRSLCESIETIIHLSNGSETESIERAKILLSKI